MNRRWWLLWRAARSGHGAAVARRYRPVRAAAPFPGSLLVTMLAMVLVGWNSMRCACACCWGGASWASGVPSESWWRPSSPSVRRRRCRRPADLDGAADAPGRRAGQGHRDLRRRAAERSAVLRLRPVGVLIYALTHALSTHIASLLGFSVALLIGVMVLLALLGRFHRRVFLLNGWLVTRLGMKETRKRRWARKVLGFRNALVDCFRLPRRILLAVFGLTTLHWLLRFSVLYLTLQVGKRTGLGLDLPRATARAHRRPSACCPAVPAVPSWPRRRC